MFQQSIPRLLPDSDIATYHWPFILIDDQTGQFWSKAVFESKLKKAHWDLLLTEELLFGTIRDKKNEILLSPRARIDLWLKNLQS